MERVVFEQLLAHLEGLDDGDDRVAAAHGRAAAALLDGAGLHWRDVLARPADAGEATGDGYDHALLDLDDEGDGAAFPPAAGVRAALDRLLARDDLAATTREDLDAFVEAAAAGALEAEDARYILALESRLRDRRAE